MNAIVNVGMEGVVVAETTMSAVDGQAGTLILKGHTVGALAGEVPFEAVVGLFLDGHLPQPQRLDEIRLGLAEARARAFEQIPTLGGALDAGSAMNAIRGAVAQLADVDGGPEREMFHIVGAIAVFGTAWHRRHRQQTPVAPRTHATHADDILFMLRGTAPSAVQARALDTYLATVVDHGMNASTFAARVVVSTESDAVSAVVAAVGALKGRLHGGAPGPVLDMLDAVGTPDNAQRWVEAELQAGQRIMGMGHRVYRVRDPRAAVLERAVLELGTDAGRIELARATERAAEAALARRHPDRALRANVEFYTAVLLEAVGVPRTMFTATFAMGRVVGWLAHVEEQRRTGRLIRPKAIYVGPRPSGGTTS